jgi:hypothetical protein
VCGVAVLTTSDGVALGAQLIQYEDIINGADLTAPLEAAFGPDGLGIIAVRGVPKLAELRQRLLPLAYRCAASPGRCVARLLTRASPLQLRQPGRQDQGQVRAQGEHVQLWVEPWQGAVQRQAGECAPAARVQETR